MRLRLLRVQTIALTLNEVDVLRDQPSLSGDAAFEALEFLVKRVQSRNDVGKHFQMFFGRQSAGDSTLASEEIDKYGTLNLKLYILWNNSPSRLRLPRRDFRLDDRERRLRRHHARKCEAG